MQRKSPTQLNSCVTHSKSYNELGELFRAASLPRVNSNTEINLSARVSSREAFYATLPPIAPIIGSKCLPLSEDQFRLAFLEQSNPDSSFNCSMNFVIEGLLNTAALEKSLIHIIKRHEALRTSICLETKSQTPLSLSDKDIGKWRLESDQLGNINSETELEKYVTEYSRLKFKLDSPPLVRSKVFQYWMNGKICYLWSLVAHNSIIDHRSQIILLQDLALCYRYYCKGLDYSTIEKYLPTLGVQYADYLNWQSKMLVLLKQEEKRFWQTNLEGHVYLELGTDRKRPPVKTYKSAREYFSLPSSSVGILKELAQLTQTDLYTVLLASFQCLLHCYTSEIDICTGTITENRHKGKGNQLKNMIGLIATMVAVRTKLNPNQTIRELISKVGESVHKAIDQNSDITFGDIVDIKQRSEGRHPFFETFFVLQDSDLPDLSFPNLRTRAFEASTHTSTFDLTLELKKDNGGFVGFFQYSVDLFDSETIARMVGNYLALINELRFPSKRLTEIDVISTRERGLLNSFNPEINFKGEHTIQQVVGHIVQIFPDKLAIVFEEQSLTYKDLDRISNNIANYLIEKGFSKNSLIGLYMQRSLAVVMCMFGILKAGCSIICLETNKDDLPSVLNKIRYLNIAGIISHKKTTSTIEAIPSDNSLLVPHLRWEEFEGDILTKSLSEPIVSCSPEDIAYVSTTSGTTGQPKGVPTKHKGWVNWINYFRKTSENYNISPASRIFQGAPLTFDASFWEILLALGLGSTIYLNDQLKYRDPIALGQFFEKHKITVATFTPSFIANLDLKKFQTLQCLFAIGEILPKELVTRIMQEIPGVLVPDGYGPTESTAGVAIGLRGPDSETVGGPISNTNIRIIDPFGREVPVGCWGEIWICGIGVAPGYLNNPEKTEQAFTTHPRYPGKIFYRTGDQGRLLSNGHLQCKGRISQSRQVKIQGIRMELGEIESVINLHPNIVQSFVKLVHKSEPFIIAYYVTKDGKEISHRDLENHLLKNGLITAKLPSAFIKIDKIPLTKNGKLDQSALPDPIMHEMKVDTQVMPSNELEQKVYLAFREIFPFRALSVYDNFWDIGGDSFKLVRLVDLIIRNITDSLKIADLHVGHLSIKNIAEIIQLKKEQEAIMPTSSDVNNIYGNISQGFTEDKAPTKSI